MATFRGRHLFALALLGVGLAMAIEGFRAPGRPRTNLEDVIWWFVWGTGMEL